MVRWCKLDKLPSNIVTWRSKKRVGTNQISSVLQNQTIGKEAIPTVKFFHQEKLQKRSTTYEKKKLKPIVNGNQKTETFKIDSV